MKKEQKQKQEKIKSPSLLDRLACLVFGHKVYIEDEIKAKPLAGLQSFIYGKKDDFNKVISLHFCPRCHVMTGLHYMEQIVPAEPVVIPAAKKKAINSFKVIKKKNKKK